MAVVAGVEQVRVVVATGVGRQQGIIRNGVVARPAGEPRVLGRSLHRQRPVGGLDVVLEEDGRGQDDRDGDSHSRPPLLQARQRQGGQRGGRELDQDHRAKEHAKAGGELVDVPLE